MNSDLLVEPDEKLRPPYYDDLKIYEIFPEMIFSSSH